jgi:hypothetical protein
MLVLVTAALVAHYQRRLPTGTSGVRWRAALAFLVVGAVAVLTGLGVIYLVARPTGYAIANWDAAQLQVLRLNNCPATVGRLFNTTLAQAEDSVARWNYVGVVLTIVGCAGMSVWTLMRVWAGKQPRTQPARS